MKRLFASLCFFLTFAAAHATTPNAVQAPAQYQFVTPQNGVAAPLGQIATQNALPATAGCLVGDSITIASNVYDDYIFSAAGGNGTYSLTVTGLPSGITATTSSTGVTFSPGIFTPGTYAITVSITDTASHSGSVSYNLTGTTSLGLTFVQTASSGTLTLSQTALYWEESDRGPLFWINFLSGGSIQIPKTNNFGHAGDQTADVLARMGPILSAAPHCGFYTLMIGTNDVASGKTFSYIEANIWNPIAPKTSIVGQLLATGRPVYLQTILPRSLNIAYQKQLFAVNNWIRSLAGTVPNLRVANGSQAYGDPFAPDGSPRTYTRTFYALYGNGTYTWSSSGLPGCLTLNSTTGILTSSCTSASSTTVTISVSDTASHTGSQTWTIIVNPNMSQPISMSALGTLSGTIFIGQSWNYSYDGLHPETAGGFAAFTPLANAITTTVPTAQPYSSSYLEAYDQTANPNGNLLPYGGQMQFNLGTGTVSGRVSGIAPDGWSITSADNLCSPCTYTGVGSAGTLADGTPAAVITMGGTASGGFSTTVGLAYLGTGVPPFAAGDSIRASCRVEVSGAIHISNPWMTLVTTAGGIQYNQQSGPVGGLVPNVSDVAPQASYAGWLATPLPAPVFTGTMTGTNQLGIYIPVSNGPSGSVAGVIKIGGCFESHG